jgi:hypothetical protein
MRQVPGTARWLGITGVLPQLACLAYAWSGDGEWADAARLAGGLYAGLILSFVGGAWWGIAAAAPAAEGRGVLGWVWVAAVLPSLIAFGAGMWWIARPDQPQPALAVLALAILASPLVDTRLRAMALAPRWWLALRWPLSLSLGLATLGLAVR